MPRGDKEKYTEKEKRQARHIEEDMSSVGSLRKKPNVAPGRP